MLISRTTDTIRWATVAILAIAVATGLFVPLPAAQPPKPGKGRDFKFVENHDQSDSGKRATSLFKNLVTGTKVEYRTAGLALVTEMRIINCDADGKTNLIVNAPECAFNIGTRVVSSPGPLQIETGDGQFLTEGKGFQCLLTNFNLIISNDVQTTIRRDLIRSAGPAINKLEKMARSSPTNQAGLTPNQVIKVFSDQVVLDNESNLAVYTGHVRVDDTQMSLACERLTIRRANAAIDTIVAERNVVIVGKQNNSRAFGDKATFDEGAEVVELTGGPARWQDQDRRGQGERLIFDPRSNTLRTAGKASVTVPRAAINQPDFFLPKAATVKQASVGSLANTNQFVEIAAETITLQLPVTNRPARTILAQTNVLITSPADQSRAWAEQATYTDATGVLELTGHVVWLADQRIVRGETVAFDRTNQTFSTRRNAYLKLPMAALTRPTAPASKSRPVPKGAAPPPRFLEIFSDDFEYRSNVLTFRRNVRGHYLEGETVPGKLACGWLTVKLTNNQVETIIAQRNVAAEQLPISNKGRVLRKSLNCELLTIHVTTNSFLSSIVAETNVVAHQTEIRPDKPAPVHTTLTAGVLTAFFLSANNQVEQAVAEQNVVVVQEGRSARGENALYTATNDVMTLSGQAVLKTLSEGSLRAPAVILQDFSSWPNVSSMQPLLGSNLARPKPVPKSPPPVK